MIYAENPEKTDNPAFYQNDNLTQEEKQGLHDVIHYAMERRSNHLHYSTRTICQWCELFTKHRKRRNARSKNRYGKNEGIVAFHGYQSFAENEITPEMAHEIGVRLANELWEIVSK